MRFCCQKGVDFLTASKGYDILTERDENAECPNMEYYRREGWPSLLRVAEGKDTRRVLHFSKMGMSDVFQKRC